MEAPGEKLLKLDSASCLSLRARKMSHPGYSDLVLTVAVVTIIHITIYKTWGSVGMNYSGDFSLSSSLWSWFQDM